MVYPSPGLVKPCMIGLIPPIPIRRATLSPARVLLRSSKRKTETKTALAQVPKLGGSWGVERDSVLFAVVGLPGVRIKDVIHQSHVESTQSRHGRLGQGA